jgi:hypothetical protein
MIISLVPKWNVGPWDGYHCVTLTSHFSLCNLIFHIFWPYFIRILVSVACMLLWVLLLDVCSVVVIVFSFHTSTHLFVRFCWECLESVSHFNTRGWSWHVLEQFVFISPLITTGWMLGFFFSNSFVDLLKNISNYHMCKYQYFQSSAFVEHPGL